jgi:N-methylhydantoinase A
MILGVDVGGTFTDAVLVDGGRTSTGKAPTTPDDQSLGVMAAVEQALDGAEASSVDRLVHGMTVGTNALLENRSARTALIATEGFVDLEELGRQARPELYRLCAAPPAPLVPAELRIAAPERSGPDGVLRPLDVERLRSRLATLDGEVEAVAVCLLWGFRHPAHERAAAALVADVLPDAHVSTSHEAAAVFREYERCATTVVDAAVSPLLGRYLNRLTERTRAASLPDPEVMLSSGGVVDASTAARHGAWTVLSGPAGGTVAAAAIAREDGGGDAVALDMGGTSCDVSLVAGGQVTVTSGRHVAGRALALPMVDIHTIGAGGGSVAWRDSGGALRVGPRSAGARPGPACYGLGGTDPTVTDASVLLGHLDADAPLAGSVPLDREAAREALARLGDTLDLDAEDTAAGVLRVAAAEMAQAVRVVTVERGIDPRELTLIAFGGAGPLHAVAIAEQLDMTRVLAPAASGVLSALGLAVSERRRDVVESVLLGGDRLTRDAIAAAVARLAERGRAELRAPEADLRVTYELRYAGEAFELGVEAGAAPTPAELRARFDDLHAERYGYADAEAELELVTVRVAAVVAGTDPPAAAVAPAAPLGRRRVRIGERWHDATVAGPGSAELVGPAVVVLPESTLVVAPGWSGTAVGAGVRLERT